MLTNRFHPAPSRFAVVSLLTITLFALGGCTVVSIATTAVGATVAVGSAAVSVATTVVSGTVKAGSAVVGTVID